MKSKQEMAESVLGRRDDYVAKRRARMKTLTTMLSCVCLCALLSVGIWKSGVLESAPRASADPVTYVSGTQQPNLSTGEAVLVKAYLYAVDEGPFSAYMGGKVIDPALVSHRIADVTLTAGWKWMPENTWFSQESLRGEVYAIEGIDTGVAVALKFLDKGDAVTTTHYYVLLNPDADLTAVQDYVIPKIPLWDNGEIVPV